MDKYVEYHDSFTTGYHLGCTEPSSINMHVVVLAKVGSVSNYFFATQGWDGEWWGL